MQEKSIALGSNTLKEFNISGKDMHSSASVKKGKKLDYSDIMSLYYNEELLTLDNHTFPMTSFGVFSLDSLKEDIYDIPFTPSEELAQFIQIKKKCFEERGLFDGQVISLVSTKHVQDYLHLELRKAGYFDFSATNMALDEYVYADADTPLTLRSQEIINGRAKSFSDSSLCNMLGAGYVVSISNEKGEEQYLLGRRKQSSNLYAGQLSILGGTPHWYDFEKKNFVLSDYLKSLASEEMEEEILLQENEFNLDNSFFFLNNFTRGPDLFFSIDVPNVSIEELASRCYKNSSAIKEHDALYALPKNIGAMRDILASDSYFSLNMPTQVALYLNLEK